jgi:hypothetical protein
MESLIAAMIRERPEDRPRIEDVIRRFAMTRESLSKSKLRSALPSKKSPRVICPARVAIQHARTIQYIILRKAAIPDRQSTYLSHLYSKVAKITEVQLMNKESLRSLVSWIGMVEGRVTFRLFFLAGVVFVCFLYDDFGYVNVCP